MNKFKDIIKKIFFDKEFYIISSPLQFINLIEYKNKFKNKKKINKIIFILKLYSSEEKKIIFINKNLKLNYQFIIINNYYFKLLIYFIIILRRFFNKKISYLIIGDFNNLFMRRFIDYSNNVVILDDGTNIFTFKKKIKNFLKNKSKIYFFSFFEKNYLSLKNHIQNNFDFIYSKVINFKKKNIIFILGTCWINTNLVKK